MEKFYIYTLAHPIDNEVRYVGYTKKTLAQRLAMHIKNVREAENGKRKWNKRLSWIKSLQTQGLVPVIQELEICNTQQEVYNREIYWIEQFRQRGLNLVNMTLGGDGGDTFSQQSLENKKLIGERISSKVKGHTQSEETIEKFKTAIKEKGHWIRRLKRESPMKGKHHSKETIAKISASKLNGRPKKVRVRQLVRPAPINKNVSKYPPIVQYTLEMEQVAVFNTAGEAIRSFGLHTAQQSNIVRCCKKKTGVFLGYRWKFKEN